MTKRDMHNVLHLLDNVDDDTEIVFYHNNKFFDLDDVTVTISTEVPEGSVDKTYHSIIQFNLTETV